MTKAVPARRRTLPDRQTWVKLHRYAGLLTACFLAIAGLTGSLLAFGHDVDAWLNPQFYEAQSGLPALGYDALVRQAERSDPAMQVDYLSYDGAPGHTALAYVSGRPGYPPLAYDTVYIDPGTGNVQGRRSREACCVQPTNLVPFMLQLHHSLYLPGVWGWWLMGGMALIWLVDCFVGFYLTLPRSTPWWKKWKPAWIIKKGAGAYRLNLDLHRAFGLWLWIALILLALSSAYLNLREEIFRPVLSVLSNPTPFPSVDTPVSERESGKLLSFDDIRKRANARAQARGWHWRATGISYFREQGIYLALMWPAHHDRGLGFGAPILYYDAYSGKMIGSVLPGEGSSADLFMQLQFHLHSGQVAGLPGRIAVCLLGLIVALLSVTGVVVWWKKYRSRTLANRRVACM